MRSSRTFGEATTSWRSRSQRAGGGRRVRRAGLGDLIPARLRLQRARSGATQQHHRDRPSWPTTPGSSTSSTSWPCMPRSEMVGWSHGHRSGSSPRPARPEPAASRPIWLSTKTCSCSPRSATADVGMAEPPRRAPLPLSVWATAQQTGPVQRRGRYVPESVKHPARMLPRSPPTRSPPTPSPATSSSIRCAGSAPPWSRPSTPAATPSAWRRAALVRRSPTPTSPTPAPRRHRTGLRGPRRRPPTPPCSPGLAGQVALVVTSPPYGPTVHGLVRARPRRGGEVRQHLRHRPGNLASGDLPASPTALRKSWPAARTCCAPAAPSW